MQMTFCISSRLFLGCLFVLIFFLLSSTFCAFNIMKPYNIDQNPLRQDEMIVGLMLPTPNFLHPTTIMITPCISILFLDQLSRKTTTTTKNSAGFLNNLAHHWDVGDGVFHIYLSIWKTAHRKIKKQKQTNKNLESDWKSFQSITYKTCQSVIFTTRGASW